MAREALIQSVAELMAETGKAHHQAFLATDGEDPEWPIWYAQHLQQPLGEERWMPESRDIIRYLDKTYG